MVNLAKRTTKHFPGNHTSRLTEKDSRGLKSQGNAIKPYHICTYTEVVAWQQMLIHRPTLSLSLCLCIREKQQLGAKLSHQEGSKHTVQNHDRPGLPAGPLHPWRPLWKPAKSRTGQTHITNTHTTQRGETSWFSHSVWLLCPLSAGVCREHGGGRQRQVSIKLLFPHHRFRS